MVVPLEQYIESFQVALCGRARGGQLADDEARTGFDAWKLVAQFIGNPVGYHAEKCLNREVGLGSWRGFGLRRLWWRKDLTCGRPSDAEGGCDDCGEKLGGGIHDEMEVATQGWSHGQSDPWQQVCVIGWGEKRRRNLLSCGAGRNGGVFAHETYLAVEFADVVAMPSRAGKICQGQVFAQFPSRLEKTGGRRR